MELSNSTSMCSETDHSSAIIGGAVVAGVLILTVTAALTVIAVVLLRTRSRTDDYTETKRYALHAQNAIS